MSTIVNARDTLLQVQNPRVASVQLSNNVQVSQSNVTGLGLVVDGTKEVWVGSSSQVFQIPKSGSISPSSISISANTRNLTSGVTPILTVVSGTVVGSVNNVLPLTNGTYNLIPSNMTTDVVTFRISATDSYNSTTKTFTDDITIVKVREGADALVGYLTNEAVTLPADYLGNVTSYTGAGGNFKVYQGINDITAACTFSVVVGSNTDNLTNGGTSAIINSVSGIYAVTGGYPTNSDLSSVTLRATFGTATLDKVFTLSKARAGTNGTNGTNGVNGLRGSQTFYIALTGTTATYSDSLATSTATTNGGPILNDMVVQYNNSQNFSQSKFWNGSAWVVVNAVVDGNLLVSGSVGAGKVAANAIETYQLKVTARGASINDDPMFTDRTAWSLEGTGGIVFLSGTTVSGNSGPTYVDKLTSGEAQVVSRSFPVSYSKTYKLTSNLYAAPGNDRNMYIFVDFFDVSGNKVWATQSWGGTRSGYVFGGLPSPGVWTEYGGKFGASVQGRSIPTNASTMKVGVWFQYSVGSSSVEQAAQNLKLLEAIDGSVVVDGSITANLIDSRGLSIRDANGDIILAAGNALSYANINPSSGWLNSSISVDGSGTIQGIGSGAGTQVNNQLLVPSISSAATTANWSGVSGTGKPADGATSGSNLIKKSTFEDGLPGSWTYAGIENRINSGMPYAKNIYFHARDNLENDAAFPVTPGETIYGCAWLETLGISSYSGSLGIMVTNSSGTVIAWTPLCSIAPNTGWTYVTGSATVPAGGVKATPWITLSGFDFPDNYQWLRATGLYIGKQQLGATVGADASNLQVGMGTNLIPNSNFLNNSLDGWVSNFPFSNWTSGVNLSTGLTLAGEGTAYLHQNTGPVAGSYGDLFATKVAVVGGARYEAFAYTGSHRANHNVCVAWYDSSNNYISETIVGTNNQEALGGPSLNLFKKTGGFAVAPSNAALGMMFVRMYQTATGQLDSWVFISRAFFGVAMAGQVSLSEWCAGPTYGVRSLGYSGDLNATNGAPAGTYVGSTLAQNVESQSSAQAKADAARVAAINAAAADATAKAAAAQQAAINAANAGLADKLTKSGNDVMTGSIKLASSGAMWLGSGSTLDSNNGVYIGSTGIVGRKGGATTFSLDQAGNATFKGTISGSNFSTGSFTQWGWPAAGQYGCYLGPEGLLLGNFNNGKYLQAGSDGNIYAPGFKVENGTLTISQANVINTLNIVGNAVTTSNSASGTQPAFTLWVPAGETIVIVVIASSSGGGPTGGYGYSDFTVTIDGTSWTTQVNNQTISSDNSSYNIFSPACFSYRSAVFGGTNGRNVAISASYSCANGYAPVTLIAFGNLR